MKKVLTIAAALFMINSANAQTTTAPGEFNSFLSAGPRVGLNFSSIQGADNMETKTGLLAGLFMVYSFQEHFGVGVDLLYSQEGAEFTDTDISSGLVVKDIHKTRLNYLRLPVQANVFFGEFGNAFRPKITLGPALGILLSAESEVRTTIEDGVLISDVETTRDVKNNYQTIDFGAIAGAGFNLRVMENTWLNFDVRYYLGATDIRDVKPANSDERKNNALSVSAGIALGL